MPVRPSPVGTTCWQNSYSAATPSTGSTRVAVPTADLTAEAVKVYPNRGRERVYLQMNAPRAGNIRVEVRSLVGRLLREALATLGWGGFEYGSGAGTGAFRGHVRAGEL